MSLVLKELKDFEDYAESWPMPVLFYTDGQKFILLAGKVAWDGEIKDEVKVKELELWLAKAHAKQVKSFEALEDLFR